MEPVRAKDATPQQIAQIHKNLARKKEDRKIEIEINEAIKLANRKAKQPLHPTNAPVQKKKKSLGLKFAREIVTASLYVIWRFIKNLSVMDWLFLCIICVIIYLFASIT